MMQPHPCSFLPLFLSVLLELQFWPAGCQPSQQLQQWYTGDLPAQTPLQPGVMNLDVHHLHVTYSLFILAFILALKIEIFTQVTYKSISL